MCCYSCLEIGLWTKFSETPDIHKAYNTARQLSNGLGLVRKVETTAQGGTRDQHLLNVFNV